MNNAKSPDQGNRTGLTIVNTGEGKGKTTAALGVVLRAWGRGYKICVIQFIKAKTGQWGEIKAAKKLGIEWYTTGDGFTWLSKDMDETTARALHGWEIAQGKIASGEYDLIVLDEFTYPMAFFGLLPSRFGRPALQGGAGLYCPDLSYAACWASLPQPRHLDDSP